MGHAYLDTNTAICFPAQPSERRAHEGPFAQALIVHAQHRGTRYELARFDLPKPLTPAKKRKLLAQVVLGIGSRPDGRHLEMGTLSQRTASGQAVAARVLSMRLDDSRVGVWSLSFPTPRQMLQVSAVGPAAQRDAMWRFIHTLNRADTATPCALAPTSEPFRTAAPR